MNRNKILPLFVLIFFLTLIGMANAQEWNYTFSSYLHGAGLTGDVTVRGQQTEVDASFGDKATESFTIGVFYRWIKSDYENEDDGFRYDTIASGPGFGFSYHF